MGDWGRRKEKGGRRRGRRQFARKRKNKSSNTCSKIPNAISYAGHKSFPWEFAKVLIGSMTPSGEYDSRG